MSRTVWGYIHSKDSTVAAYFVQWTLNAVQKHGVNVDLIVGKWGDGTTKDERQAVSLVYRLIDSKPQFMIIDSHGRPVSESDLVGRSLSRDEVIGTELSKQIFELVDVIWEQDGRVIKE